MGRPSSKRTSSCLWGILIFLAILAVGGVVGFRWYMISNVRAQMSPEEVKELEAFFSEPVEIPLAWRTAEPYPEEITRAREELVAELANWTGKEPCLNHGPFFDKINEKIEPTEEEWKEVGAKLLEARALIDTVTRLVGCRGYELQIWPTDNPNGSVRTAQAARASLNNTLMLQAAARLLVARGLFLSHQGDFEAGFESNLKALRLACRHPASTSMANLLAIACELLAVKRQCGMVDGSQDAQLLRRVLKEMNEMDPKINHRIEEGFYLREIVAALREHIQNGKSIDLSVKKPRVYFYDLFLKHGISWAPAASRNDRWDVYFGRKFLGGDQVLVGMALKNLNESLIRERTAHAEYDLARLCLANRIRELEGEERATTPAELVPAFFEKELTSPFTGKAYLWDSTHSGFYGVGPNVADEGNRVGYSPTNGTISSGDLSVH